MRFRESLWMRFFRVLVGNKATSSHFILPTPLDQVSLAAVHLITEGFATVTPTSERPRARKKPSSEVVHHQCFLINTLSITQSCTSFCCGMKFLRHCRESNRFWWRSLLFPRNVLCCAEKECSIERGGLEFPKQLNCSGKCFFEESRNDSNPITPQLSTLSQERPQKVLTLYRSVNLRHTIESRLGTEKSNGCQGQNGASRLNSFIPSPGKIPRSFRRLKPRRGVDPSLQRDLFFCGIFFSFPQNCWLSHRIKRTSRNRSSPINFNPVNRFGKKGGGRILESVLSSVSTDTLSSQMKYVVCVFSCF